MPVQVVVIVISLVLAGIVIQRLASMWLKYRGQRVITCPENQCPAGVVVDAGHAAATALVSKPDLRLATCSRWPERAGCGQQCLSQIESSPEDCLVRTILVKWYAGKNCVSCGRPIGEIAIAGSKPAVLCPGKPSIEWSQIPAERLQETLADASPICFACHMASTLVREHPELAVNRPGMGRRA